MFSFRIYLTSNSFFSFGLYWNVDCKGVSGLAGWSKETLNIRWILIFFSSWSLRMAGPGFTIIIKGLIFLWSNFLLEWIV